MPFKMNLIVELTADFILDSYRLRIVLRYVSKVLATEIIADKPQIFTTFKNKLQFFQNFTQRNVYLA